ncbi:MAG: hypothetical protein COW28_05445 [bacterium (Candidatus Ratteibacteria) CG15_BIG_FIL_POST_REV_8_21_14_020_41_12]|uniref:Uncharacterized protein n=5 Tax=Candidatus Ratteibacteria TaxID=2979319 RepID=A0A2M7GXU8_9BACT|nr:MAG: hypothetical protein COW28_05445 [bacterium (Candidatus Ratteibacteria) CG15_BIG_FIL_POST_REV_8_21_14_020_41_12]
MMRKTGILVVLIVLFGAFSIFAESRGEIRYAICKPDDVVNIRAKRSPKSPIVARLKPGQKVKADFLKNNEDGFPWYAVFELDESRGDESSALGYVYAPLLALSPPIKEGMPPEKTKSEERNLPSLNRDTISLNFKDADIRNVLRILAEQNNLNIIAGKEVEGTVTVHLCNVSLENALHSILSINGFGYERIGNIILVTTLSEIKEREKKSFVAEPLITEIFRLEYVGAEEIKEILVKELSSRGSVKVLSRMIQGGWEMGGVSTAEKEMGKKVRIISEQEKRPTILVVTDTSEVMQRIKKLIANLDIKPNQILIEAMIVEVNSEAVRDIGIQWHTTGLGYQKGSKGGVDLDLTTGTPSITSGVTLIYDRTIGEKLKVEIRALEEKKKANVLSNPKIMTLDGHEAIILVGERYPILKTEVTGTPPTTYITESFDRYEPIGISLRVVPHLCADGWVNMLIHPEVTSLGEDVTGSTGLKVKRINTREADTNVRVKEGETIVIGGLRSEKLVDNVYKVPLLGDIPVLGYLFKRTEKKPTKIDLLIFITPHIIEESKLSPEERKRLEAPSSYKTTNLSNFTN